MLAISTKLTTMGNYGRNAQKRAYREKFQLVLVSERKARAVGPPRTYDYDSDSEGQSEGDECRGRRAERIAFDEEVETIAEIAADEAAVIEAKRLEKVTRCNRQRSLADLCRIAIWKNKCLRNQFKDVSKAVDVSGLEPKMS